MRNGENFLLQLAGKKKKKRAPRKEETGTRENGADAIQKIFRPGDVVKVGSLVPLLLCLRSRFKKA